MRRNGLVCLAGVLAGCPTAVVEPPDLRSPVVEGLLLADSATALFRIVWSAPAGAPPGDNEVAPADVELWLAPAAGAPARLVPVAESPSYFRASIPIVRGTTYSLRGTIADRPVHATSLVPSRFAVAEPAADTLVSRGDGSERRAFRWSAAGADAYYVVGARVAPGARISTRDTAGELLIDRRPASSPPASPLTLVAITASAEAYLFDPASPRGNVEGAFGFLGAGIAIRKVIRWR